MTIYAITMYDWYDYRHYYEGFYADADKAWFEYCAIIIQDAKQERPGWGYEYDIETIEVTL